MRCFLILGAAALWGNARGQSGPPPPPQVTTGAEIEAYFDTTTRELLNSQPVDVAADVAISGGVVRSLSLAFCF